MADNRFGTLMNMALQMRVSEIASGGSELPLAPISVLVADDDSSVRAALVAIIASEPTFVLCGEAADADEAIDLASQWAPDVALLDVVMPGGGGPHAAREIIAQHPKTRVVALSAQGDRTSVSEMLHAGAIGYLVKGAPHEQVLDTLRRCAAGESIFAPAATGDVMRDLLRRSERQQHKRLQARGRLDRIREICTGQSLRANFQPIFDLATGELMMVEALARFNTPEDRGPAEWFGEAAEIGALLELEVAAIETALDDMRDLGAADAVVSINASPSTLTSPALFGAIGDFPADRIVLEMTEHAAVDDYELLGVAIEKARSRGMRLAVDDVGAGFSSMRHILQLMPDFIKIDISITSEINADRAKRALAAGLISFAAEIGAQVIAEGVETEAELATLRALGVEFGQGYFLARPAPLPLTESAATQI